MRGTAARLIGAAYMRIPVAVGILAMIIGCGGGSSTGPSRVPRETFLRFTSDPGDGIGRGVSRTLLPDPSARFGGDMWEVTGSLGG